ncbi:MAG: CDP-glucose 4,6-dehydratase, partial [Nitrospinae bacterium CG11_big_fil_rev_8_21_14_0_20_56_8]
LCLGERLLKGERPIKNQAFNFGPQAQVNQSVGTLISELGKFWNGARWETKPAEGENKPESTLLKLNCDKALHSLDWQAALPFEETVRLTGTWYRNYYETGDSPMAEVTRSQIEHYVSHARKLDLPWSR